MAGYRLTHVAQADVIDILAWSEAEFGEEARKRYETLIANAIRAAASSTSDVGHITRPELGEGVFSWHLAQSRAGAAGQTVRRPQHFLICRREEEVLVVGRVLHDAMAPRQQVESQQTRD